MTTLAFVCLHWSALWFYDEKLLHQGLFAPTKWIAAQTKAVEFANALPEDQRQTVRFEIGNFMGVDEVSVFYCDNVKRSKK